MSYVDLDEPRNICKLHKKNLDTIRADEKKLHRKKIERKRMDQIRADEKKSKFYILYIHTILIGTIEILGKHKRTAQIRADELKICDNTGKITMLI